MWTVFRSNPSNHPGDLTLQMCFVVSTGLLPECGAHSPRAQNAPVGKLWCHSKLIKNARDARHSRQEDAVNCKFFMVWEFRYWRCMRTD